MGFKKPEIAGLDAAALADVRKDAIAAAQEINSSAEALTPEQNAEINEILDFVDEVDTAITAVESADAEATATRDRLAALEASDAEGDGDDTDGEGGEDGEGDDTDGDGDGDGEDTNADADAEAGAEREMIAASGQRRPGAARRAARKGNPQKPDPRRGEGDQKFGGLTIVAAANVPDMTAGQKLEHTELGKAFLSRVSSFGGGNSTEMKPGLLKRTSNAQQHGVARLKRPTGEFALEKGMDIEQQFETIMAAAKESSIPGGKGLVAAGGWCAPSEQIWGFCELETTEGLLSVPEVVAKRGGISFTRGPQFGDLFADPDFGFIQTEAQAIAGTEKPFYAVECPPWEEVRLDAIGFGITAPILTNAAYPELVRRVLNLAGVGHARRLNASTIARIAALITNTVNWAEIGGTNGSATSDALDAAEFVTNRIRQQFSMSPSATVEGIAPWWMRSVFRGDLSRRLGVEMLAVSDADIDRFFAVRGVAFQYVYDYQMLTSASTGTWTRYPTSVEFMLYPAGSYVRLTNDVINLDAVYDHDLLSGNEYTAAFFEEGIAVANTCGGGYKVTVDLNMKGSTGYPAIGAAAGVSFAPAA
jgi:hypothetical protein